MKTTTPMATVPPITCTHYLEHARDSMDSALDELTEANKLASGLASLLLLDMIRETSVMGARIRQIINASNGETSPGVVVVTNAGPPGSRRNLQCPLCTKWNFYGATQCEHCQQML